MQLVAEVEQMDGLWDMRSPRYKDRVSKVSQWVSIAEKIGATAEQCKVKWNSLRTNFNVSTYINAHTL